MRLQYRIAPPGQYLLQPGLSLPMGGTVGIDGVKQQVQIDQFHSLLFSQFEFPGNFHILHCSGQGERLI
jgi:hypothetical protein